MKHFNIIIISIISAIAYSCIIGLFGFFGDSVQSGLLYFIKNILPFIAVLFGYFLIIFIPIRVFQAIERNKEIHNNQKIEEKIVEQSESEKEIQEKILNLLNEKDTL